jgi:glycosyltransferase involved in cell wall biosynthesis
MGLAVITICRDPGEAILATAASITAQTEPLRWIVIDGASRDGTPERLRALPRPPDLLTSAPDLGIADAFNRGLASAGDDEVLFLNAGDRFSSVTALAELSRSWDRTRHHWVVGMVHVSDEHGRLLGTRAPPAGVLPRALVAHGNRIPHPAVLAGASFLRGLGGFDPAYRYAMDYELWLRAIAAGQAPQVSDVMVADFALGGISGDVRARLREDRQARDRHGLSDGRLVEAWLTLGGWARRLARPVRRLPWAYRLNQLLRW